MSTTVSYNFRIRANAHTSWERDLHGMANHIRRTIQPASADSLVMDAGLHGPENILAACKGTIAQHCDPTGRKLRQDAVRAVEVALEGSSPYFLADDGSRDLAQIRDWAEASAQWLRAEFGDTLISAVLNLDESVPHIHALVVPLIKGELCYSQLFPNRPALSDLQAHYADALAPLGVERKREPRRTLYPDIHRRYARAQSALALHRPQE